MRISDWSSDVCSSDLNMGERNAKLNIGEESQDYAILSGSVGPDVLDIRKLYANTGMFTFDPGFTSTASCESGLTYIDGDQGVLLHRGYPIEQLAAGRSEKRREGKEGGSTVGYRW